MCIFKQLYCVFQVKYLVFFLGKEYFLAMFYQCILKLLHPKIGGTPWVFFTYACSLHLITENWKVSNKYKQYSNYKFAARPYLKSFTEGPSSDLALLKVYQKRYKSESGILIIMVKVFSIKNINTMHAMRVYTSREIGSSLIPFPHSILSFHSWWTPAMVYSSSIFLW